MKTRPMAGALLILGVTFAPAPAAEGVQVEDESARVKLIAELRSCPHKILFESYADDNWDLFMINADGSDRTNLTNTPDIHEMYPQASPDGSKICFLADVQEGGATIRSVCYMSLGGGERVKAADRARQPCWSPDGAKIAFVKQEFTKFNVTDFVSKGLYFYDVKTGRTSEHPNQEICHLYNLTWSADGRWIVATVHGGMGYGHAIVAIEADGFKVHDLKIPGCRPCLSPDGTRITWSPDDHTICAADVELTSSGARVSNKIVVDHRKEPHLYHPDFSPDGKYITYSIGPGGRVFASGPGTHTQVAEMVGVRGKWNLLLKRASGEGPAIQLTLDENLSNKESEWLPGDVR